MELYHVLNRGVDKRTIFDDDAHCARFVRDIYEFNDIRPAPDAYRRKTWDLRNPTLAKRKRLIDLHGWCLMKNHYHLLVSEIEDGGLTKFIRKLNVGYANYYNELHEREGALFQGRTKKVLIEREAHFLHILHYIHLNPLDFLEGAKGWREGGIASERKAMAFLRTYRWSSFPDYSGQVNFPSILNRELFEEAYGGVVSKTQRFIKDISWKMEIALLE